MLGLRIPLPVGYLPMLKLRHVMSLKVNKILKKYTQRNRCFKTQLIALQNVLKFNSRNSSFVPCSPMIIKRTVQNSFWMCLRGAEITTHNYYYYNPILTITTLF